MTTDDPYLLQSYTGAEAFLVGISPTYWAHVPMLIRQVRQDLKLVHGVHCLLWKDTQNPPPDDDNHDTVNMDHDEATTVSRSSPLYKVIPISKCKLVGTIVCVERKGNGSTLYVIDDGTGLMDCLHWEQDDDDGGALPSLTGREGSLLRLRLQPGVLVQVWGRIHCVATTTVAETATDPSVFLLRTTSIVGSSNDAAEAAVEGTCNGNVPPCSGVRATAVTGGVREIHVNRIAAVTATSRGKPWSLLDSESQHWLDCIQKQQSATLWNALDILPMLGPVIGQQVANLTNLPSADDTIGAWRLFGRHCTCLPTSVIVRDLLYCHCIATPLPGNNMDLDFKYRDSLLEKLLLMEEAHSAALLSFPALESNDDPSVDEVRHLRFQYRMVVMDEQLNQIALQQIQSAMGIEHQPSGQPEQQQPQQQHVQQLVRSTFRALRKDGILYLLDVDSDTYLLISRQCVLEPHLRRSMACSDASARTRFHANRPLYLSAVPRARMQLVRRTLVLSTNHRSRNDDDN